ncbi:hypothetical protein HYW75_04855 [Candidatus Pacearchaeota archaeon]|nr:hypothetical protein [Candidatus Pacearchaeota archaeon]
MEVILDSNFIISCIKRKINFLEDLENLGFKVLLPKEVYQELKDLRQKVSHNERNNIDIALSLIEKNKIKKIRLGNKIVDEGLIEKGKKGCYVATLDSGIKRAISNKVIISEAKNSLIIERS